MAHKRLQCWPLWLVVDCVYVGMFLAVGLWLTALLYLVFTVLAVYGWRQWHLAARTAQRAPVPA